MIHDGRTPFENDETFVDCERGCDEDGMILIGSIPGTTLDKSLTVVRPQGWSRLAD
jgi:hypothetical protein